MTVVAEKVTKAMCKLCKDKIQAAPGTKIVTCKCKEIFVTGSGLRGAKDMHNLIDDTPEEGCSE